jgi:putative transposase
MSWVRVWIHIVFSTKNREPFLNKDIREALVKHILMNAKHKEIWIDSIGGFTDHIHCLVSLGRDQTISKIAQLIKGESSYWLNKNFFHQSQFQWQDDYWAVSVSEKDLKFIREYILNQDSHHIRITFKEEFESFPNKINEYMSNENYELKNVAKA